MNSRVAPIAHVVNFSAARVGVGALMALGAMTARLTGRRPELLGDDPATVLWRRNLHIRTADAFDDEDEVEDYSLA